MNLEKQNARLLALLEECAKWIDPTKDPRPMNARQMSGYIRDAIAYHRDNLSTHSKTIGRERTALEKSYE